jgi:hypothetical protein
MATWKSQPIFVSSTFADMQAERDHLRSVVFPALEERLRSRRSHVEWVDLRLGVATASLAEGEARELQVLKVCLAEVRRCRPFLIVLLGDRYGWVPPAERILAAAREEGMDDSVVGRSVTELEIQFGIFDDPQQQPRSFVYLREALDYSIMPSELPGLYSDERSSDSSGTERAQRLASLKADISTRMPDRVRTYRAAWDQHNQRVTGLDSWGQQVVNDIIAELDKDATGEAQTELTWQQVECLALDDFTADRARDFVGRETVLARLEAVARSPKADGAPWALSLTGEAGAGKSAIFSVLRTRLQSEDVVVLAHAAGASPQAPSVDLMLLSWIEELASILGVDPGLPEKPRPDDIDTTFASLLGRVGLQRRVVVLIDALDQLETTVRGRQMAWLPKLWSDNARLITTAIPGEATKALSERKGTETETLGPITRDEARQIIDGICGRYHRTFEPEVIEALLAKSGADRPAWSNTLWLVLAIEDLNLVDADDFEKALKRYHGSPAEQLRAMMVDRVSALPSDIAGVYLSAFGHAEDLFDAIEVRSFLGAIAVSRGGWRESDFSALMPKLAGLSWDELRFATLRRLFRGQVKQRGVLGQWTLTHTQMAAAVSRYLDQQEVSTAEIHTEIADHLLSLPPDDPLRHTETMLHLLGSGDLGAAARYYGNEELSTEGVAGATSVLADAVLTTGGGEGNPGLETVSKLLDAADSMKQEGQLAFRLVTDLDDIVEARIGLTERRLLIEMVILPL